LLDTFTQIVRKPTLLLLCARCRVFWEQTMARRCGYERRTTFQM